METDLKSYNELKEFYQKCKSIKSDLEKNLNDTEYKLERTEGDLEDWVEDYHDLEDELEALKLKYRAFDGIEIHGLNDEYKFRVLANAFKKYNLDELENRLDVDWL